MDKIISILVTLSFWVFVGLKVGGAAFADWSWWWVLFAPAPVTFWLLA